MPIKRKRTLSIPLRKGPNGFFARCGSTKQEISEHLKQLVFVSPGERFMRNDIGVPLWQMVWEPADEVFAGLMEMYISSQVEKWMTEIRILSITVARIEQEDLSMLVVVTVQYVENKSGIVDGLTIQESFRGIK